MSQTILNLEEAKDLEIRASHRLGEDALMRRAGAFAADAIAERAPGRAITVLAGPGNNGGDALCAARLLKEKGFAVTVVSPRPQTSPLAKQMREEWLAAGGEVIEAPYMSPKADLVVDGLFGTGLDRPLKDPYLDAVLWFSERQAYKVSLDVPTGLNAETGHWAGEMPGCRADLTITFLSHKAGLYMNDGAEAAGEVLLSELDVSVPLTRLGLIGKDDYEHILKPRDRNSHKGTFGHLAVVGGADGHVGAAMLAARAGLRMGAGTVTLELLAERAPSVDPVQPEVMLADSPVDFEKFTAAVIGPGLGTSDRAKARLEAALSSSRPLVIDADALNLIAADKRFLEMLLHRTAATIITPHEVEGARLLHVDPKVINANRVDAVRDIALQTGATTVLKGPGTLIAMRSSRTWLCPKADASLATAGSGDVLAGMIGAFLAQRYDTIESVLAAVSLHAEAPCGRLAGVVAGEIASAAAALLDKARQASLKRI